MNRSSHVVRGLVASTLSTSVLLVSASCGGGGSGGASATFVATLDRAVCDPSAGPFSLTLTNRFFPLPAGRELVLEGTEDGELKRLVITVLNQVEIVAGVSTRVVEERETVDGELVEISRNFFAAAPDGTLCYFGEDVDIYEDGAVASHDGAWRAGVNGARPGIVMPAAPKVGDAYEQEDAPGVAEDRAQVTVLGENVVVPAGTFDDTLTTVESSGLEPGSEIKIYASGVGLVDSVGLQLTSVQ